jgi:CPA2 family monovalent cation:H+ antiporter-2
MSAACAHLDQIDLSVRPDAEGVCPDCVAIGGTWMHLRECMSCGHVGCCDNSPNRHATRHHEATQHAIIRSLEPGEDWYWCYVDELAFLLEGPRD